MFGIFQEGESKGIRDDEEKEKEKETEEEEKEATTLKK